jgi:GTPase SAR1 family protein
MNDVLDEKLLSRHSRIEKAKDLLEDTKSLFEQFGSAELKGEHSRFPELLEALNSDEVRLVIIGEFSRGKSSLANALLGIDLLPTAQQATTAINTFIRQLPKGRTEPYLLLHFRRGRPAQEIRWTDSEVLERWGTELDESNRDARFEIDYIEAYTNHRLLARGLCVVDTPGLQSVMSHHEAITLRAIAQSHVALWVQSASQLGGTSTEWRFVNTTVRANFRKFLTVINMWDKVLQPDDPRESRLPVERRVAEKLEVVRNNFRTQCKQLSAAELALMTDDRHLIGVSSQWALRGDSEQRRLSGIERLSQRLGDMMASGEAMEEIYSKPMKQLADVQTRLVAHINEELAQLDSDASMDVRKNELESLVSEIGRLEAALKHETGTTREEHRRAGVRFQEQIRKDLVHPLVTLKLSIEENITEVSVASQIRRGVKQVALPAAVEDLLRKTSAEIDEKWHAIKTEASTTLEDLRADYLEKVDERARSIDSKFTAFKLSLPEFNAQVQIDFDALEDYRKREAEVKRELEGAETELGRLDAELADILTDDGRINHAKAERDRTVRRLESLGPPPLPTLRRDRIKTSDWGSGFLWLEASYATVEVTDDSNVRAHQRQVEKLETTVEAQNAALQKIIDEEHARTGKKMSLRAAQNRQQVRTEKLQREARELELKLEKEREDVAWDAMKRLQLATLRRVEDTVKFLGDNVAALITTAFDEQCKLLELCVTENLMQPLNAKRAQREAVQELLNQGQVQVDQRRRLLVAARQRMQALHAQTVAAQNDKC